MGRIVLGHGIGLRVGALLVLAVPFHAVAVPVGESEDVAGQEIVQKYLEASRTQQSVLRGGQMEVKMNAKLPRLDKQGVLLALRRISNFGKITYKALGFSGDNMIKNEVIARYLTIDAEGNNAAITPTNYKFKYKGLNSRDGRTWWRSSMDCQSQPSNWRTSPRSRRTSGQPSTSSTPTRLRSRISSCSTKR